MRAIVDTNVFISFLLNPGEDRIPSRIVAAALTQRFDLLISDELLREIESTVDEKSYLKSRISAPRLIAFFRELRGSAGITPELSQPIAQYTRDPKDDYLIAHALAEEVDVLVSGDRDLLALDGIFAFRILSPADFAAALGADATE